MFQGYFEGGFVWNAWFFVCVTIQGCGYRVVSYKEWKRVFFGVMVVSAILFIFCPVQALQFDYTLRIMGSQNWWFGDAIHIQTPLVRRIQ